MNTRDALARPVSQTTRSESSHGTQYDSVTERDFDATGDTQFMWSNQKVQ